jgi:SAM-dependent methyltransferase
MCRKILGDHVFSVLDVGCRTAAGTAYLRLVHHPSSFNRLKFAPVEGVDIDPQAQAIAAEMYPDVRVFTGDIFQIPEKQWDIVTCSHTIEHVYDAEAFVRRLECLARRYIFLACPFDEDPHNLIPGHVRSIGQGFFDGLGFLDVEVYDSAQWHSGRACFACKEIRS